MEESSVLTLKAVEENLTRRLLTMSADTHKLELLSGDISDIGE